MTEYDIKRGHWKEIEGAKLGKLIEDIIGAKPKKVGKGWQVTWGAMKELNVEMTSKSSLVVTTVSNFDVSEDVAAETNTRFRKFLLSSTAFNSKQRRDRMKKRLAKG